jgi:hypothetical protein
MVDLRARAGAALARKFTAFLVAVLVPTALLAAGCGTDTTQSANGGNSASPTSSVNTDPPAELQTFFSGLASGTARGGRAAVAASSPGSAARLFAVHHGVMREALSGADGSASWSASVSVEASEVFWDSSAGSRNQESLAFAGFHYDSAGRLKDWHIERPNGGFTALSDTVARVKDQQSVAGVTVAGATAFKPPNSDLKITFTVSSTSSDADVECETYKYRGKNIAVDAYPSYLEPTPKTVESGFAIADAGWGGRLVFDIDDYDANRYDKQSFLRVSSP